MAQHRWTGWWMGIFGGLLLWTAHPVGAMIVYSADYENQSLIDGGWDHPACAHEEHMLAISSSGARAGNYGVRFEVWSDEAPGLMYGNLETHPVSCELEKYQIIPATNPGPAGEWWYGASIKPDASWTDRTSDPNGVVVLELHQQNDSGESGKSPHLSIRILPLGGGVYQWRVENVSDPTFVTTESTLTLTNYDLSTVQLGQWTDWVIHAVWSYQSNGVLQVWKDGALVVNVTGPNQYNDAQQEMMKFGIYKSWWNVEAPPSRDVLIVYHDRIRVGDANSSYNEIALAGGAQLSPPSNLHVIQ
jgi:hypothetical protein